LFSEKKSWVGTKSGANFFLKKKGNFTCFEPFVKYKVVLGAVRIMRPIYIYSAVTKVYLRTVEYEIVIEKKARSDFDE
jgi:hypothetical protein